MNISEESQIKLYGFIDSMEKEAASAVGIGGAWNATKNIFKNIGTATKSGWKGKNTKGLTGSAKGIQDTSRFLSENRKTVGMVAGAGAAGYGLRSALDDDKTTVVYKK